MSYNLTPLEVCERVIGPPERLAAICGKKPKAGYGWRRETKWRRAGDFSAPDMRALLAHAGAKGLPLTADHLIWGAPEAEIAALLGGPPSVAAE